MPFSSLPEGSPGFKLWEKVHDEAKNAGDDDETAAKKAWGALKNAGYEKQGDKWVKKSDFIRELSMTFTSAPFDKKNGGEMRFRAVASDTGTDSYDENMTLELYRSFCKNVNRKAPVPEAFRSMVESEFWKGGMPYISVSHYPDLDGFGVPGMVQEMYIDGNRFKGKGKFFDTEIGRSCYRALLKDEENKVPPDKKIRLSIAFLDLAHQHGDGPVFKRNSLSDFCPECAAGVGNKKYLDGYCVHWAMTRVPVNKRADIEVDKSMSDPITREQDAASIIDPELAEELEKRAKLIHRSEVLVEMSKTKTVGGKSYPASDFLVVEDAEKPSTWHLQVKENGKPNHNLMGAAKAALTSAGGHRGNSYEGPSKGAAISKLKRLYSSEKMDWGDGKEEKSMADNETDVEVIDNPEITPEKVPSESTPEDATPVEAKSEAAPVVEKTETKNLPNQMSDDDLSYLPYGGMEELQKVQKIFQRGPASDALETMWGTLNKLVDHIFVRDDIGDKNKAIHGVVSLMKGMTNVQPGKQTTTVMQSIADKVGNLNDKILEAKSMAGTDEEKLVFVQPALNELGEAIKSEIVTPAPVDPATPDGISKIVEAAVERALAKQSETFQNEIAVLKAQFASHPAAVNKNQVVVPRPRSYTPDLVQVAKSNAQAAATDGQKPSKLHDLVRKSVGLQ